MIYKGASALDDIHDCVVMICQAFGLVGGEGEISELCLAVEFVRDVNACYRQAYKSLAAFRSSNRAVFGINVIKGV